MRIREEGPEDAAAIREVLVAAFEQEAEADLVDRLRAGDGIYLSLVADVDGRLVGHILFTEVTVSRSTGGLAVGLAPMAVLPGHQRTGVGSDLIEAGLKRCREKQVALVVVLGHPDYYPRFGFVRADTLGLEYEDPVPLDAFMALPLDRSSALRFRGKVSYRPEFKGL